MIALASDCLVFRTAAGENIPLFAEAVSVELMGDAAGLLNAEFVQDAANAVFHYFKHELDRQAVSAAEFAGALEKALRGFACVEAASAPAPSIPRVVESDLSRLAGESTHASELFFFPRLRDELRHQLRQTPRLLRFHGLRGCVKRLLGARRWTPAARALPTKSSIISAGA
jgi:hypothetical protein